MYKLASTMPTQLQLRRQCQGRCSGSFRNRGHSYPDLCILVYDCFRVVNTSGQDRTMCHRGGSSGSQQGANVERHGSSNRTNTRIRNRHTPSASTIRKHFSLLMPCLRETCKGFKNKWTECRVLRIRTPNEQEKPKRKK